MRKLTLFALILLAISNLSYAEYIKGSQHAIAMKYAGDTRSPVMTFDPGTGAAKGFIQYADLDGVKGDEIIIPYTIRKGIKDIEDKADTSPQTLVIDVVKGEEVIRDFIKVDLAYVRRPKVYLTIEKIDKSELAKVFLMVNDGFEKGWDKQYRLVFNSFDEKDKGREKEYETVKMPWEFILYQWKKGVPSINEFETVLKQNYGKFYIRLLDKGVKWPKIPMKELEKFKEDLTKHRKEIYWEYGYE